LTSFTITHTGEGGSVNTYTSNNIKTINIEYQTPIVPMPLPQMADSENILIKVEGNTTLVNVSWTLIDDGTQPFSGSSAQTAIAQVAHFRSSFVPVDMIDNYSLVIGTGSEAITLLGTLQKMSFSVSGRSPITWDGSFQFVHGNQAVDYDEDLAKDTTFGTLQNNSGTNGEVNFTTLKTEYLGVDAAITHYVIAYQAIGSTVWNTVEHATTTASGQNITVDLNVTGNHKIKVAAKTTTGTGTYTNPPVTVNVT
tara:strand:- start:2272 stop:3030 length:759 start_codon:yes stop_codon:yes gene_type:complete